MRVGPHDEVHGLARGQGPAARRSSAVVELLRRYVARDLPREIDHAMTRPPAH